jgi:hypothetical protein
MHPGQGVTARLDSSGSASVPVTARRLYLAVCLCLPLAGCVSNGGRALPDAQSAGARVFVYRCSQCHDTPHPRRHDYAGWKHLIGLMEQRMTERGMMPLTDSERTAILSYLKDNSR